MDEKYTVQTAMRWIVEQKGRDIFQNDLLINNMLSDLAREEERDRKKIRLALSSGAGNVFFKILQHSQNQLQISDIRLFQSNMEEYGFTPDFSVFVLNTFLYAVSMPPVPAMKDTPVIEQKETEQQKHTNSNPNSENAPPAVSTGMNQPIPVWEAGDIVSFGRYQQDAGINCVPREIEWIVLDVQENKALLLSKFGLISKPFDTSGKKDVSWETCTLRTWMNNDFFITAFNNEEQKSIVETEIESISYFKPHNDNISRRIVQKIQDKLFLLSLDEAKKYFHATDWHYSQLRVSPTDYAISCGAAKAVFKRTKEGRASMHWWTRVCAYEEGRYCPSATTINKIGVGSTLPVYDHSGACVRPALWVDMNSGIIHSI